MTQFEVNILNFIFKGYNLFFRFVDIEFKDTRHFNFEQTFQVVGGNRSNKMRFKRFEAFIDMIKGNIDRFCLFEFFIFVNSFLDKNLFERAEMELLQEFVFFYLQFTFK